MFKDFIRDGLIYLGDKISSIPYKDIARKIIRFIGDLLHRTLFTVLLPKKYRSLSKQEIYTIIFKSDTPKGKKFDIWLLILIGANIVTIMLESMAGTAHWFSVLMRILGWGFTILFTFEYYLRIYCLKRPWKYILSVFGIIDFLSIFPAYLSLLLPAASTLSVLRLMRVLRIFRIFKMQRFLDESRFLINALQRSAVKILIFMLFVFVVAVILGATMYGIEGGVNPAISSIPEGIYWAVVTITTVGYGDIAPVTHTGRFVSLLVMLLGYAIIAVPTGIVAGETIEEHRQARNRRYDRRYQGEMKNDETAKPTDDQTSQNDNTEPSRTPIPSTTPRRTWDNDPGARITPEDLL